MTPKRTCTFETSLIFLAAIVILFAGSLFLMANGRASRDARAVTAAIGENPQMFRASRFFTGENTGFTVSVSDTVPKRNFRDPAVRRYLPATCERAADGGYTVSVPDGSSKVGKRLSRSGFCDKASALGDV